MFSKQNSTGFRHMRDGIEMRLLVRGEKTSMFEFILGKGYSTSLHSHPHEQTGYLLKGHLRFKIGGDVVDVFPGDSWCIPGGVEHDVEFIEDSTVIEIFSPVREEYLLPGQ